LHDEPVRRPRRRRKFTPCQQQLQQLKKNHQTQLDQQAYQLGQRFARQEVVQRQLNQQKNKLTDLAQLTQIIRDGQHTVNDLVQQLVRQCQGQLSQQQHQLNGQRNRLTQLKRDHHRYQKNLEYLYYVFGTGIAGYIYPLLSWIDKKIGVQNNKNNETVQKDVQILQILSFGAVVYSGKIDEHFNGFTQINDSNDAIWCRMAQVALQFFNAFLLVNCCDNIVGHSKKNDNHALKTIRKLPQPIKTFGRLFIEWGFWRIEKGLFQKFRPL